MRGGSYANGPTESGCESAGNSFSNGSGPNWQRHLYGWVHDPDCWTFTEAGC